ncbi:hypothetical protein MN116_007928 [Schistosoma mekongi]|uniref:Uncharacterized protein n=1 Tax=Schistosoma mekongi TaxID=38744 RepID=A0AAE1Z8K6_SCHME|nr:hypothetical protein MN116_007928 [Schistosoma mekongi]
MEKRSPAIVLTRVPDKTNSFDSRADYYYFISPKSHHHHHQHQLFMSKTSQDCNTKMTLDNQNSCERKIVDICDLILDYVTQFPLSKDIKSRVNLDDIHLTDIDLTRLHIIHKKAEYLSYDVANGDVEQRNATPTSLTTVLLPTVKKNLKSHVLFSSLFTNNTSETQTNHLRTERRTSSSCRISLQKVVTKDGSINLQIGPPSMFIQANGGFRHELTLSKDMEEVFEEELIWTLDTELLMYILEDEDTSPPICTLKVIVPPGYRTRAELVITEDEYNGKFQVETIFEGSISVKLRDKKDGSVVSVIVINDLSKLLNPKNGFYPVPNSSNAVSFINEGFCHCHFGIGQRVELQEEKI